MLFPGRDTPYWSLQVSTTPPCVYEYSNDATNCRICIALRWEGQYVGLQILPGVFEVVHMGEDIPKITLRHRQRLVKYLHAVFRLLSRNRYH